MPLMLAKRIIRHWLPLGLITCAFCSLVYLIAQQSLRIGANDPQIQLAEDTAAAITLGTDPAKLVLPNNMDIVASLAPFVMVFDATGDVIVSSGTLDGKTPALPAGVLDSVKANGEDRITWQPEPGVRIAAVIVPVQGSNPGYVLAGRSLREVENRIGNLELIIGAALVTTLVASLLVVALVEVLLGEKKPVP